MIKFEGITTAQLVAAHNEAAEKLGVTPVTKFKDRATAEERTRKVISMITDPSQRPEPFREAGAEPKPEPEVKKTAAAAAAKEAIATTTDQTPTPPVGPVLPIASDNEAKDKEMPTVRKVLRHVDLKPKNRVFPRKEGSKQAALVDMLSRPEGATFGELYDGLRAVDGKPWTGVSVRSGLAWDINHLAGYGVTSEAFNGEQFLAQGRTYEANRLGFGTSAYNPEFKLLVYRLTYPKGQDAPLPHTPRPVVPSPEQKAAAKKALAELAAASKGEGAKS